MNIEKELFKKAIVDFTKLEKYGFTIEEGEFYKYSRILFNNFRADIVVNKNGKIKGKIIDLNIDDEYIGYRVKQVGEFANKILELYQNLLLDIKDKCFNINYFIGNQANRVGNYIMKKYGDYPEFLWDNLPEFAVFRNKTNNKWYGIVYNILKSKITDGSGYVDAINVKAKAEDAILLKSKTGIYEGYHSNKKYWVSIILDDTLSDVEIFKLIDDSYNLIVGNKRSD